MRSADIADLRPEAWRGDRIVNETNASSRRPDARSRRKARRNNAEADGRCRRYVRRWPAPWRSGGRWRQWRHATAARISDCRSFRMWRAGAARRGRLRADDGPSSLAIHSMTPARLSSELEVPRTVCDGAHFFAKVARPKNDFRLIGLDQTRQHVFGGRGIDQRGRVAGGGRGKQTDQCFGIHATEQKHQTLSLRRRFSLRDRGSRREAPRGSARCRCGRHKSPAPPRAARSAEAVRRRQGRDRSSQLWTRLTHWRFFQPASDNEAAINPDDLPSDIR